jgi:hypothetical protein
MHAMSPGWQGLNPPSPIVRQPTKTARLRHSKVLLMPTGSSLDGGHFSARTRFSLDPLGPLPHEVDQSVPAHSPEPMTSPAVCTSLFSCSS